MYAADRAYDDGENHYLLEQRGLRSALHLNSYRTKKRDANTASASGVKEGWLALLNDPDYRAGCGSVTRWSRSLGRPKLGMAWGGAATWA